MNKITDELLKRRASALRAAKRKRWFLRGRSAVKGGGDSGLSVTANRAPGQLSPTNTSPINFTIVFSQAVTGFAIGDITFGGSTVGGTLSPAITGTGPSYNVAVTGMTGQGDIRLSILPGIVVDAATGLLTNSASNVAVVAYDAIVPSVTIAKAAGQPDPAGAPPITYTVTFSEPVTGFLASDVTITGTAGGTKLPSLSGTGPIYSIEITGMTTGGTVIASIPAGAAADLAGNLSTASGSATCTWSPDVTRPSVTINKAAGQADPTSASPILYTITFDEVVTGFTSSDITITGPGTLSLNLTGAGPVYTLEVSGMSSDGNVTASILANVCTDLAGNLNFASTSTDNIVQWIQPAAVGLKAPLGMGLFLN
jgi:hypothetical protein